MLDMYEYTKAVYQKLAPYYDKLAAPAFGTVFQREAIRLLQLRSGDVVVDVGCGTGACFPFIEAAIGETGRLIGIDLVPEMLERARLRVTEAGWSNVTLINAAAEQARLKVEADAFLFSFTHDVLQSLQALRNLFRHAKPGARVAACGIKWAPWWSFALNAYVAQVAWQYHSTHRGLSSPWAQLAQFVRNLEVRRRAFDTVYVAHGTIP
jgi:ubiquinone/menaquinone biosynthesis C-methylase UbiE